MNEASILLPSAGCLGIVLLFGLVLSMARARGVPRAKAGSSYEIREWMDELTPAERAAEKRADEAWADKQTRDAVALNGGTEYQNSRGEWIKL